MSAEEPDQTLNRAFSMRCDVSGSNLNHIAKAVQCRGPSWGCAGVLPGGVQTLEWLVHPSPHFNMHLDNSPKFRLSFQLAMWWNTFYWLSHRTIFCLAWILAFFSFPYLLPSLQKPVLIGKPLGGVICIELFSTTVLAAALGRGSPLAEWRYPLITQFI